MNDICEQCGGKCCQGIIDVYSNDEIFYDDSLVWEMEGVDYDRVMRTDENQRCIALKNGKCSIYEKRPLVCRSFQVGCKCCDNFRMGYLNSHSCKICVVSEKLPNNMTEKLIQYKDLMDKVDKLVIEGKDGADIKAEDLRDKMDDLWYAMTEDEQDYARRYSMEQLR
jgi:Fe-S-cluster containining protein